LIEGSKEMTSLKSLYSKEAQQRRNAKPQATPVYNHESDDSGDDENSQDSSFGSSGGDSIEYLAIAIGIETNCATNLVELLRQAEENNLNFVCVPLFHPRLRVGETLRKQPCLIGHQLHRITI
jgi:hypothetical protein